MLVTLCNWFLQVVLVGVFHETRAVEHRDVVRSELGAGPGFTPIAALRHGVINPKEAFRVTQFIVPHQVRLSKSPQLLLLPSLV